MRVIKLRDKNGTKKPVKDEDSASVKEWNIFKEGKLVPDDLPKCYALQEMMIDSQPFEVLMMECIAGNVEDRTTWRIFNRVSKLKNI
jgi:hypothetical protein